MRDLMHGDCPECGGALIWGGHNYVPHSDTFHAVTRRFLLKALRDQLERQKSLTAWQEMLAREGLIGFRWRNGVYSGWQSEERWELAYEWWDSTLIMGDREFILAEIRGHLTYLFENQHGIKVNQATWFHKIYDPRLARLGTNDDRPICGSAPPSRDPWGDCWCTLHPDHNGLCYCGPCSSRTGTPGWTPRNA